MISASMESVRLTCKAEADGGDGITTTCRTVWVAWLDRNGIVVLGPRHQLSHAGTQFSAGAKRQRAHETSRMKASLWVWARFGRTGTFVSLVKSRNRATLIDMKATALG
jgi:hypothetical protein